MSTTNKPAASTTSPASPSCLYPNTKNLLTNKGAVSRADVQAVTNLINKKCGDRDNVSEKDTLNNELNTIKKGTNYCTALNGDTINTIYRGYNSKNTGNCVIDKEDNSWNRCTDGVCCKLDNNKCVEDNSGKIDTKSLIIAASVIGAIIFIILLIIGIVFLRKRSKSD